MVGKVGGASDFDILLAQRTWVGFFGTFVPPLQKTEVHTDTADLPLAPLVAPNLTEDNSQPELPPASLGVVVQHISGPEKLQQFFFSLFNTYGHIFGQVPGLLPQTPRCALCEGRDTRQISAEDTRVAIVGSFVGVDRREVVQGLEGLVLIGDAVGTENVTAHGERVWNSLRLTQERLQHGCKKSEGHEMAQRGGAMSSSC